MKLTIPTLLSLLFITAGCYMPVRLNPILNTNAESARRWKQVRVYKDKSAEGPRAKVLLIPINGVIGSSSSIRDQGGTSAAYIRRYLDTAKRDKNIKAILLKIDSPGGTVVDSDFIYQMILRFAKKRNIPVYAHIDSLGASGAYYIAMTASHINAAPVASVGSIGVIMRKINVKGLLEKIGVEHQNIKTGKNKDTYSPFRKLREDEVAFLQEEINAFYENFLKLILKGRAGKISEPFLRKVADGRVYRASVAKQYNLIDSVSYIEDYLVVVRTKLRVSGIDIVTYVPDARHHVNLYNIRTSAPGADFRAVITELFGKNRSGMYYLPPNY